MLQSVSVLFLPKIICQWIFQIHQNLQFQRPCRQTTAQAINLSAGLMVSVLKKFRNVTSDMTALTNQMSHLVVGEFLTFS